MLHRRRFFAGRPDHGGESTLGDIAWLSPGAEHMTDSDWSERHARAFQVWLNGEAIAEPDMRGEPVVDDSFLLLFNAAANGVDFALPPESFGERWTCVLDTGRALGEGRTVPAGATLTLTEWSTLVLTRKANGR